MAASDETKENSGKQKGQLDPDKIESEILANERTFLAWVRTSIAVMSLGFVIARFSVWMREVSLRVNPQIPHRLGISAPLGECMIGLGALLTLFAACRYRVVNRAIERGEIAADPKMVIAVTVIVLGAAAAVIAYMVLSSESG
jgi:inner membrane protein YidH